MSNPPTNDNERRLEQLVAYLDGELPPAERALVEKQLAQDAALREDLQGMERAWSALDVLPTTKVDDRFAQTTMEMVVGAARAELLEKTRTLPLKRRKGILGKVLLATAAAMLGLLAVRLVHENPNRRLLADLPVIQYIDTYTQFRDLDFLNKLHDQLGPGVWVSDLTDDALAEEQNEFLTVSNTANRREWVTTLDEENRGALLARYNRFVALSPTEQARLRELHAAVVAAPNSAELERTMLQYRQWLSALPASRQYELRDMPVDKRVHEIVTQQRREANNPWIELTPEENRRLEQVKQSLREQIVREMGPRGEFGGPRRSDRERDRGPGFVEQLRSYLAAHRSEWLPKILESLSEEHREKFAALEPRLQQQQLVRWIMQSRGRNAGRGPFAGVTQQELEQFFVDETDPAQKERLLALPRDQMERELRQMYFRSVFGEDFGPSGGGPFGPPPRGDRGGRRGFGGSRDSDDFQRPPPPPREEEF